MATFNITVQASNACGGGFTTVGPYPISAGSIVQGPLCPLPTVDSPLNQLTGFVDQAYSGTFSLGSVTSLTGVSGLPSGVTAGAMNANGDVTLSGTPIAAGTFPIYASASNACGGGSSTSSRTGMLVGTLVITNSGGGGGGNPSGVAPSQSGRYESSVTEWTTTTTFVLKTGFKFKSDGTVAATSFGVGSGITPNWYLTTTAGVGSGFWINAEIVSNIGNGAFSTSGDALGTWHQLNADRTFECGVKIVGSESSRAVNYRIRIATDAAGSNVIATYTDCMINLDLLYGNAV